MKECKQLLYNTIKSCKNNKNKWLKDNIDPNSYLNIILFNKLNLYLIKENYEYI